MRKCGECKQVRPLVHYSENRHGNLHGRCKLCIAAQKKRYREYVLKPRMREEKRIIEQKLERETLPIKNRPCSVFQGFLFSGDVA